MARSKQGVIIIIIVIIIDIEIEIEIAIIVLYYSNNRKYYKAFR